MPALLGIPALFRFLIGLVPLAIGYFAKFTARIATRTGLLALALVGAIMAVFSLAVQWLSGVVSSYMPQDYGNIISSLLPDNLAACINVMMSVRIAIFIFDLKERFISMSDKEL